MKVNDFNDLVKVSPSVPQQRFGDAHVPTQFYSRKIILPTLLQRTQTDLWKTHLPPPRELLQAWRLQHVPCAPLRGSARRVYLRAEAGINSPVSRSTIRGEAEVTLRLPNSPFIPPPFLKSERCLFILFLDSLWFPVLQISLTTGSAVSEESKNGRSVYLLQHIHRGWVCP